MGGGGGVQICEHCLIINSYFISNNLIDVETLVNHLQHE